MELNSRWVRDKDRQTRDGTEEIVELGVLLTGEQVALLEQLARERGQTIGQVMRGMILNGLRSARESLTRS